ncbi:MAG: carbohydrate kinase family protein [Pseudomonadota bacterium]
MKSLHFGSAMIDIITLVASENIEQATFTNGETSFLMLEAGRKLPAEQITTHVGGGGCNTAVGLARRGWETAVLAKVGEDVGAAAIRAHLDSNGVEDRLIPCPAATGTAVMVASHDRNASIFVHRGANETLTADDLPDFGGLDMVYVAPLSSASADAYADIVRRAHEAGALVASNPGIRQIATQGRAFLAALSNVDLVSVNRVEAETLAPFLAIEAAAILPADAPPLLERGLHTPAGTLSFLGFLDAVRALGPRWVVVTDGTQGAYLAGPEGALWQPPAPADVVGTAGAGDAFCSTLAAALAEGLPASQALAEAACNAAAAVGVIDTTSGLLDRAGLAEAAGRLGTAARQLAG